MDGLIAFLKARIDEDKAGALAAAGGDGKYGGRPNWSARFRWIVTDEADPDWAIVDLSPLTEDRDLGGHIARHDPARALREVEAKRAILRNHRPAWTDYKDGDGIDRTSNECVECEPSGTPDNYPCPTLRILAAVYSDHPDYDPAWSLARSGAAGTPREDG